MIPFPLVGKFLLRHWRIGAAVAVVLLAWWQIVSFGNRREADGRMEERIARQALDDKATAEHNARIDKLNEDHHAKLKSLEQERDAALARPASRTIRVPIHTVCPAKGPADAGLPQPDPADRYVSVPDPGYGEFRAWLIHYGAGAD